MGYHISRSRGTIDSNQSAVSYASNRHPAHKSAIRNYEVVSAGSTFVPTDIANLSIWVDASQESFNNNDPVGLWTDRSGNSNHMIQAVAGNKPLFKTNQVNGKPAILSDGDDYLDATSNLTYTSSQMSTFIVVKDNESGISDYFAEWDGSNQQGFIKEFVSGKYEILGSPRLVIGNTSTTAYKLLSFRKKKTGGDVTTVYYNGTQSATDPTAILSVTSKPRLFGESGSFAQVYIAEFLIYTAYLDDTQMSNVHTYLVNKYNLS